LAVWKSGSLAVWQCGVVEVWQCGSVEVWQCGSVEVCRLEVWKSGSVKVWKSGSVEEWTLSHFDTSTPPDFHTSTLPFSLCVQNNAVFFFRRKITATEIFLPKLIWIEGSLFEGSLFTCKKNCCQNHRRTIIRALNLLGKALSLSEIAGFADRFGELGW